MPSDRNVWRPPRVDIILRVEYVEPSDLLHDYVTSLGEGGMFIYTDLPIEPGEPLSFMLSFPGLLDPVALNGVVRERRLADDEGSPAGLSVEFVFADAAEEQRLRDLLDALGSEEGDDLPRTFRVLLVEDNVFALELFEYAVTRFHREHLDGAPTLEVKQSTDAFGALKHLEASTVDLAIVDHFLPGMTGCELVQRMRGDPRLQNVPVVVVSVGGAEVKEEAYRSGADLYLDKPVLHKQLIATISKLLGGSVARWGKPR